MIKQLRFSLLILIYLLVLNRVQAQEKMVYFSEAITDHLKKYNQRVDRALAEHDDATAKSLFDSLVSNHLKGTLLDPLYFEGYKSRMTSTLDFDKPTLLWTYSAWCIPNSGEIPVLNKMASRYAGTVNFVVLYFDHRTTVRKAARQFDRNINVVYVDETTNRHMLTEKLLKQALGTSLSLVISEKAEILDISRRPPNKIDRSIEDQLMVNHAFLTRQMAAIHIDTDKDIPDLPESFATWD